MTPFTFIIKRKAYALAALVALTCAGLASCTDDNLVNNNGGGEKVNPADAKLATTTVTFSAGAGMQLPNITRAMDPDAPATRAVSVNKYMPLAEGSNLKARIFVVKADPNAMTMINGKKAMDPEKVIMGAGEVKWDKVQQIAGGGVSLRSNEDLLTLTWLSNNSVHIKPGEDWYICGIIGGEYDEHFKKLSEDNKEDAATRLLAKQLYNFYVKFNPSKDHNTRDANGKLRVTAAFSTGWTKLKVEKTNVINLRSWAFKALGTLLRFRVKRDTKLVKPEAHKYTFASSQLTANGGFLMMPLSKFTKGDRLDLEHQMDLTARYAHGSRTLTVTSIGNMRGKDACTLTTSQTRSPARRMPVYTVDTSTSIATPTMLKRCVTLKLTKTTTSSTFGECPSHTPTTTAPRNSQPNEAASCSGKSSPKAQNTPTPTSGSTPRQ